MMRVQPWATYGGICAASMQRWFPHLMKFRARLCVPHTLSRRSMRKRGIAPAGDINGSSVRPRHDAPTLGDCGGYRRNYRAYCEWFWRTGGASTSGAIGLFELRHRTERLSRALRSVVASTRYG